jgi:outer membrane protein assembly factor BamB
LFVRAVQIKPRPARRLPAEGAIQAAVVFDEQGTAFVADMVGAVQGFSSSGKLRWRVKLSGGVSATPAVHPAKPQMFVGTHAGWVYALDTATGATLWRKEVPTKSDPRILSDLLYLPQADAVVLSSWGGRFHALDAGSGAERFSWDAGISPYAAAAADQEGNLYCLRAVWNQGVELVRVTSKGEETLRHPAPEEKRGARRTLVSAAPVLDERSGVAYFVINRDQGSRLHAWSLKSSSLLWTHPLPNAVQGTPALRHDGVILLADLGGSLHAIGPDGTPRFRYASGCEYLLAGGVCEAGGTCFIGDPVGVLHAINGQGAGHTVFEAKRSIQARPSFATDGSLYLPATDRTVYVFPARPGARS